MKTDEEFIKSCIELARRAEGRTAPNPLVGALVVDQAGEIVGRGFHRRAGEPHAEVLALEEAGQRARGSVLYVNLEPCCHRGRTPPCVERIIAQGVARVVAGMVDPNPLVAGGGIRALKEAGIEVVAHVLEEECCWLNRGFIKVASTGLPWLCLKLATTLDGRIADRSGKSRWITGQEARRRVHELRNSFDCVLVGGATVVNDDPSLNVRDVDNARDPLRAIVDTGLSLPASARVCDGATGGDTVVFCSQGALMEKGGAYSDHVGLVAIQEDAQGHLLLPDVLAWLAEQGTLTVLCEGGARLAGGLLSASLVDEVAWFVSPQILGDEMAYQSVSVKDAVALAEAWRLSRLAVERLGADVLFAGPLCR